MRLSHISLHAFSAPVPISSSSSFPSVGENFKIMHEHSASGSESRKRKILSRPVCLNFNLSLEAGFDILIEKGSFNGRDLSIRMSIKLFTNHSVGPKMEYEAHRNA